MAEIMAEHLPAGVFNVICGDRDTGRALVTHPTPRDGVDHRQRAGRHGGRRCSRGRSEAGPPRARGQGACRRLRRRRPREGGRRDRRRRLLQRRAGLHGGDEGACRPRSRHGLRRGPGRAGPRHQDRRHRRRGCRLRPAQQPRAARAGQRDARSACPITPGSSQGGHKPGDRGYPVRADGRRRTCARTTR